MRKHSFLLISLFFMQLIAPLPAGSIDPIRVGVTQNTPLTFIEDNGKIKGFLIDILEHIAKKEGWDIEYVPSSWPECLSNLKSGKIDLLGGIAYSESRGRNFDYTFESIITNWGQMYLNKKSEIESIIDLKGKKVAVLQNDIFFNNLRKLVDQSGIKCRFIEAFEYEDVLELVEIGRCEAGLVNQIYGLQRERDYDIVKSSILLSPQKLYWAAPKGKNQELLYSLDRFLRELKNNQQSIYHEALANWFGIGVKPKLGRWFKWMIISFVALLSLFFSAGLVLRVQVKLKTKELLIKNEELRESEERFRNVYDTAPLAFVVWDINTRVIDWNKKAEALFGWAREEIIDNNFFDFLIPEKDRPHVKDVVNILLKGELQSYSINDNLTKDGRMITCEWNNSPLHDDDGNIIGAISLGLDITERKQAEEALQESEELLKATLESTADGILVVDENGNVTHTNSRFAKIWRIPNDVIDTRDDEKLLNYVLNQLDHPKEFLSKVQELYNSVNEDFDTIYFKDGRVVKRYSCPLLRRDEVAGRVWSFRDITERKQAEEALRESEEKYRTVLEANPDPVVVYDIEGKVIYFNPAFTRVFGWTIEERLRNKMDVFVPEEAWRETKMMIEKVLSGERFSGIETRRYNKKGEIIPVSISGAIYKDQNGNPIGSVINLRDITEQKKLEAQLQQAHKIEAIGTLAGGMAHDINNILGIIIGNTELAMDDIPDWNPARLNLKEARIASLRAKDVVRQLLSFARKTTLEKKPTNIIPIVKESFKLLRSSIPTSIEIRQNIMKDVDTILTDSTQINQIMINLCTNAAHAMPDGGIIEIILKNIELDKANAAQHPDLRPGRYVNLTVTDTGHGISKEDIDRIFDPYFTTKEVGKVREWVWP